MKRILSILLAVMMIAVCLPVFAVQPCDVNPIGRDISNVHAAYLTAGGNPSPTDFLTLDDFASHTITLINVWSNGCGPCIAEMPYFQQVHEEFADRGVLIVGCCSLWINGSYSGEWNHLQQNGYTYMNVIQDSVLQNLYSLNNYVPQTFIVNSEGIVVDFIGGGTTYSNLVNKIGQWLGALSDDYYDVEFVDGLTGETIETQNIHAGSFPVYPEPPVHEGYSFSGWSSGSAANPSIVLEPMTITANYTIRTFRVRFYDSITGTKLATKYVQYGSAAEAPEPPEHEGYVFEGWDKDFSFVSSNMDVYTVYREAGSEPVLDPGDVNGDNEITSLDALLVLRASLSMEALTPEQIAAADMNGDGEITSIDALMILRISLGLGA